VLRATRPQSFQTLSKSIYTVEIETSVEAASRPIAMRAIGARSSAPAEAERHGNRRSYDDARQRDYRTGRAGAQPNEVSAG